MIAKLKNGIEVIDRHNSHLHNGALEILKELLPTLAFDAPFIKYTHKFPAPIGVTHCVRTDNTPPEDIYYKKRENRRGLSRFVKNREPEPCDQFTLILKRDGEKYFVITAFVGGQSEPEPWDKRAFSFDKRGESVAQQASIDFWSTRALIEE